MAGEAGVIRSGASLAVIIEMTGQGVARFAFPHLHRGATVIGKNI